MWSQIYDLIKGLGSGLGTELGWFNIFLLTVVVTLAGREWKRIKAKVDIVYDRDGGVQKLVEQHDVMWEMHKKWQKEFDYRKRQAASAGHEFSDTDMMAGMAGAVLKDGRE